MRKQSSFIADFIINHSKEEFENYYNNHSNKEVEQYFRINKHQILKLLDYYNILSKHAKVKDKYKYYEIETMRIDYKNMSNKDFCSKYGIVGHSTLSRCLDYMGLRKRKHFDYNNIDIETFKDYYYNHNRKETAEYFNISLKVLGKIINKYNLFKNETLQTTLTWLNEQDFYNYYINQKHTNKETAEHFNISSNRVTELDHYYKINKLNVERKILKDYFNQTNYKPKPIKQVSLDTKLSESFIVNFVTKNNLRNKILWSPHNFEKEVASFLGSSFKKDRTILDGLEIDFYDNDLKIGVECDGTYWHSILFKDKDYHFNKSLKAESKGVHLIHIYEYEWTNPDKQKIIKSFLNIILHKESINKIYARNCEIRKITNKEAKKFNEHNHLQGHRNAQVTFGLFYNNKLVQLMSFSKSRYNKNLKTKKSWEIIRGCPGSNNIVVGGVSKLFKHFIQEYDPDEIFSYCDFNKFDGKGYTAIGMKFIGYTGPDMKWVLKDRITIKNRNPIYHNNLKKEALTQIYGAGSKKYLWTKS